MALDTVELTKIAPSVSDDGLVSVGFDVVLKDGVTELETFTVATSTAKTADISLLATYLGTTIQNRIDNYKFEQVVAANAKYTTLQTMIENNLTI